MGSSILGVTKAVLFDEHYTSAGVLNNMFEEQYQRLSNNTRELLEEQLQRLNDNATIHCKGLRKLFKLSSSVCECGICYGEELGYRCINCPKAVCCSCIPMAFQNRVMENTAEGTIDYKCPYCILNFISLEQVSFEQEDEEAQANLLVRNM